MKLSKILILKTEKKSYYKYRVTIPNQIIKDLRFKGGETLDVTRIKNTILITQR